ARALVPLLHQLVDPTSSDRDQGDLGGHEEALQQGQQDDNEELGDGQVHRVVGVLGLRPSVEGLGVTSSPESASGFSGDRGSRILAGTPTASLPGGTSLVTTAPAPVFARSPIVTGARSIVSTPRKTSSPIVVRCLRVPS